MCQNKTQFPRGLGGRILVSCRPHAARVLYTPVLEAVVISASCQGRISSLLNDAVCCYSHNFEVHDRCCDSCYVTLVNVLPSLVVCVCVQQHSRSMRLFCSLFAFVFLLQSKFLCVNYSSLAVTCFLINWSFCCSRHITCKLTYRTVPFRTVIIIIITLPDIHVDGLMFYHGFFFFLPFFIHPLIFEISTISSHMVGSKCNLKTHL